MSEIILFGVGLVMGIGLTIAWITGVAKVGSVGGRFNIYHDTHLSRYELLGYKGPE